MSADGADSAAGEGTTQLDWILDPDRLSRVWSSGALEPSGLPTLADVTLVEDTRDLPTLADITLVEDTRERPALADDTQVSLAVEPTLVMPQPAWDISDIEATDNGAGNAGNAGMAGASAPASDTRLVSVLPIPLASASMDGLQQALDERFADAPESAKVAQERVQAVADALDAADMAGLTSALDALEDTLDALMGLESAS